MKNEIIDNTTYTLIETAELTGYDQQTLKRRIYAGRLKVVSEAGEKIRILGSEIKHFLKLS